MDIVHLLSQNGEWLSRLIAAVLMGGAIGFEREYSGRPAGFRTHILVCVGACLAAMVDASFQSVSGRVAANVVTGVGFLGAGTILRSDRGQTVHGLTTAASLWTTAGLGIAAGFGRPTIWYACAATLIVLLTLSVAPIFEDAVLHRMRIHRFHAVVGSAAVSADTVTAEVFAHLASVGAKLVGASFDGGTGSDPMRDIRVTIRLPHDASKETLGESIAAVPNVVDFRWEI
ncbi:MAG: MgtC/SapB family protein [Capsulimonadaceae bacterium]|nr:MgtC/SapB family protein [Capsulimonadaceae bacterium]